MGIVDSMLFLQYPSKSCPHMLRLFQLVQDLLQSLGPGWQAGKWIQVPKTSKYEHTWLVDPCSGPSFAEGKVVKWFWLRIIYCI